MKVAAAFAIAIFATGTADAADGAVRPEPYVVEYKVKYGSLTVGTSRTELRRSGVANQWIMETRLTPNGLGRLVAGGAMLQHSEFHFDAAGVRPLAYRFEDGAQIGVLGVDPGGEDQRCAVAGAEALGDDLV